MITLKLNYALVFLCCASCVLFKTDASRITFKAYPDVLKANLTTAAAMRCGLADTEVTRSITNTTHDIAHVTSILITRGEGQIDVAQGSPYEPPSPLVDLHNLEVKGDVTGTSSEGFLELSWKIPSLMPLGEYVCEIQTIDAHHHQTVFRSSLTMSMVAPSINDVVVLFQTQNQQLKDLTEKEAKNTAKNAAEIIALEQKLDALEKQDAIKTQMLVNQTLEIASLKQQDVLNSQMLTNQSNVVRKMETCASTRVAFMAVLSSTSSVTFAGDTKVVYDKVITNTDGGYDPKTGEFKCTTPGVYLVSVSGSVHNNAIELDILINSVKITSFVSQAQQYASGFASAVVILKMNDIVHVKTEASWSINHALYQAASYAYQPNVFEGTLLHSDNCVF